MVENFEITFANGLNVVKCQCSALVEKTCLPTLSHIHTGYTRDFRSLQFCFFFNFKYLQIFEKSAADFGRIMFQNKQPNLKVEKKPEG